MTPASTVSARRAMDADRLRMVGMRLCNAVAGVAFEPRPIGRLASSDGVGVAVTGLSGTIGDLLSIESDRGWVPAEVIGFRDTTLMALPLGCGAMRPGARVRHAGSADDVPVGPAFDGRVVDGWGQAVDGAGPIAAPAFWPRRGRPLAALARAEVTAPLWTGVRPVDALLTLGRGQRIGLMAGSGVGKTTLLHQIIAGATADTLIVALIGERGREIAAFVQSLDPVARARTQVIAVPADDPMALRIRGVERAFAAAEQVRSTGRHALLVVDSLTRVAHAQRQLGLAVGEPAGPRGYPASALSLIPRLVERAGNDARTGGAVTAILTVLADGDDLVADPVIDTARGVLDGHIMLSRDVAARGRYPAIDIGQSISRTMATSAARPHIKAATRLRADIARLQQVQDLRAMGAYAPGHDPEADRLLALEPAIDAFLNQPLSAATPAEATLAALDQGWGA